MSDTKQKPQREISPEEWLIRLVCVLLAAGMALLGSGGMYIAGLMAMSRYSHHHYDEAACLGVAALAAYFGITPMAMWVNRALLSSLTGLEPYSDARE